MHAITSRRYGPPDVLILEDVPRPSIGDGDVLVRVRAVEATKSDCELRSFKHPVSWYWLPLRLAWGIRRPRRSILGGYFAGEIAGIGRNISGFREGDAVYGCTGFQFGAYAEYVSLPATAALVAKPDRMSFEEAAAVPLGGLNALHFLQKADIAPGEEVLINGAGGSIGTHGIQIARAFGARVTAVDHGRKEAGLRAIGAQAFIDYTRESFAESGRGWDVILDMVASSPYAACIRSLKPGGRYLKAVPRLADFLRAPLTTRFGHRRVVVALAGETRQQLTVLSSMIDDGQLGPIVDSVWPMDQAADAHRRVETEARIGAVVIRIDA